jgi:hypothetical protein
MAQITTKKLSQVKKKIKGGDITMPDNIVRVDKMKTATETLERMSKCRVIYQDLLKSVHKLSAIAQDMHEASVQVTSIINKLSTLHIGDLGNVIGDIASYCYDVDTKLRVYAVSLQNDFVAPLARSMDPHQKEINEKMKDLQKRDSAFSKEMAASEKLVTKASKSGQQVMVEAVKEFNLKKEEVDQKKAEVLLDVFSMERERYLFIIEQMCKVFDSQVLYANAITSVTTDLPIWKEKARTKNALSEEQLDAIATRSEQTFKQVGDSSTDVVLYRSTNDAIKRVDETETTFSARLKNINISTYKRIRSIIPETHDKSFTSQGPPPDLPPHPGSTENISVVIDPPSNPPPNNIPPSHQPPSGPPPDNLTPRLSNQPPSPRPSNLPPSPRPPSVPPPDNIAPPPNLVQPSPRSSTNNTPPPGY